MTACGYSKLSCRIPQAGFTLLELLVVMTLLSLLMTGLISALRTMAQSETRIDQRLERLDEIRSTRNFLQRALSRVSATKIDEPGATGKSIVPFFATSDSLTWVGIFPARPNVGGKHYFRLAIEPGTVNAELVLRFAPTNVDMTPPDWSQTESRVIAADIVRLTLNAQGLPPQNHAGSAPWPQGWQDGWPLAEVLPEQVRLQIADSKGDWVPWIFSLRPLHHSDRSSFGPVVGGGAR